jgi:hypothetical protein
MLSSFEGETSSLGRSQLVNCRAACRQQGGIATAKAKGKHLDRVAILDPGQVKELHERVAAGENKGDIA